MFKVRNPVLLLFSSSVVFPFLEILEGGAHICWQYSSAKAWRSGGNPQAGMRCVDSSEELEYSF